VKSRAEGDGLKIVDAHFHLWNLDENYYPWLSEGNRPSVVGDYSSLRRNYEVGDFISDTAGLDVIAAVHIQAEHDPRDNVRETRWLQGVADRPGSRGIPQAIVVNEDLAASGAEEALAAHCAFRNVRGMRQALHRRLQESPAYDPLLDPAFRKNFALLEKFGLSFDLQFFPQQGAEVESLVRENARVQFILTHAGMPLWHDEERLGLWRRGVTRLAQYPNVATKISGFGMWDGTWTSRSIDAIVSLVLERFSPARCMLASNFPVEGIHKKYADVWRIYAEYFAGWSADERRALFCDNALRYYRIDLEE
jgi:predicted TIM-barrel fold metal-dependent hydrolase